jgi:hypothetical protein
MKMPLDYISSHNKEEREFLRDVYDVAISKLPIEEREELIFMEKKLAMILPKFGERSAREFFACWGLYMIRKDHPDLYRQAMVSLKREMAK